MMRPVWEYEMAGCPGRGRINPLPEWIGDSR